MTSGKDKIDIIDSYCNASNIRFKRAARSDFKKFSSLPSWLNFKSRQFEKEINYDTPKGYYYYRRGTVISVDFGINVGSQFSGHHFAVVLNKKDNNKNTVLTVVPLTSKSGKSRLALGKEIFDQSINSFSRRIYEIEKSIEQLELDSEQIESDILDIEDSIDFISKELEELKVSHPEEENFQLSNDETKHFMKVFYTLNNNLENAQKKGRDFSDKLRELTESINLLKEVSDIYSNYNKNSFARVSDIQTISKKQIRTINKFDPSGRIQLPTVIMAEISKEIIRLYASK